MDDVQRALEIRRFITEAKELRYRRSRRLLRELKREAAGLKRLSREILDVVRSSS